MSTDNFEQRMDAELAIVVAQNTRQETADVTAGADSPEMGEALDNLLRLFRENGTKFRQIAATKGDVERAYLAGFIDD